MTMCLQMIQKPPVVFTQYDPAKVISQPELFQALASRRCDAVSWLWLSYGRALLADAEPCMEANEGAEATMCFLSSYENLSDMKVTPVPGEGYKLMLDKATLFLSETVEGDTFLYFFSPEKPCNRRDECRIDLTAYGSDAAACFIAALFGSYNTLQTYLETKRNWASEEADR